MAVAWEPCHPTGHGGQRKARPSRAHLHKPTLAGTAWPPAPQSARRERAHVPRPSGAICLPNLADGLGPTSLSQGHKEPLLLL